MSNMRVSVILEAVDRLTAPIRRMQQRVTGAFDRLGTAAHRLQDRIGNLMGRVARIGLIAGAAAGGVGLLTTSYGNAAEEALRTAQRLGIGVEAYQELGYAAERSGVSQDTFSMAMQRFTRRAAEAVQGGGEAEEALERLGIRLTDSAGRMRPTEDMLAEVADALAGVEDPAERVRLAFQLFDSEGVRMLDMLAEGSDGMAELRARARELGVVIDEEAARAALDFNDALTDLSKAGEGLRNTIGGALLPILTPLVTSLTDWVAANRALIAQHVERVVQRIADAIGRIPWREWYEFLFGRWSFDGIERVPGLFERIGSAVQSTVDFLGGWENAAIALVAVLNAGLIASIIRVGVALVQLGAVLLANPIFLVIAAIAGLAYLIYDNWGTVGPWFAQLWEDIVGIFQNFVDWVAGIFTLDFARAAEGLRGIWRHLASLAGTVWDGFREAGWELLGWIDDQLGTDLQGFVRRIPEWWDRAWSGVRSIGERFVGWLGRQFGVDQETALHIVETHWNAFRRIVGGVFGGVLKIGRGFLQWLGGVFTGDQERAAGGVRTIWDGVVQIFETLWEPVEKLWDAFSGWVEDTFGPPLERVASELQSAWQNVAQFFEDLWADVETAFQDAWETIEPIVNALRSAVEFLGGLSGDTGGRVEGLSNAAAAFREQNADLIASGDDEAIRAAWQRFRDDYAAGQTTDAGAPAAPSAPTDRPAPAPRLPLGPPALPSPLSGMGRGAGAAGAAAGAVSGADAADAIASRTADAVGNAVRQEMLNAGGRIEIRVMSDGPRTTVRGQPNDRRMGFSFDTGYVMGGS